MALVESLKRLPKLLKKGAGLRLVVGENRWQGYVHRKHEKNTRYKVVSLFIVGEIQRF